MILPSPRKTCYQCFRPQTSCVCDVINPLATKNTFVILMHPKEFKKTKNITGHMSHLSLENSFLFVDDDFTQHPGLNKLLHDPSYQAYVLYPDTNAVNLSQEPLPLDKGKKALFILIDSTWACSKKMISLSKNIHSLPRLSFNAHKLSQFKIKQQPFEACLSTIETIHTLLEILVTQDHEKLPRKQLENFLNPFQKMVNYQLAKIAEKPAARFKKHIKL